MHPSCAAGVHPPGPGPAGEPLGPGRFAMVSRRPWFAALGRAVRRSPHHRPQPFPDLRAAPVLERKRAVVRDLVQRGVEEPQVAFQVAGTPFANAVGLVDRCFDDVCARLDAARVMGIDVVHGDHGHAGGGAE